MRLRVATLNVWGLPFWAEHIDERVRAIGERLASLDLDVAVFQEVWTGSAREALVAAGRRADLPYAWHRHRLVVGSGLLVLSRLPFEDVDFDRFDLRARPSRKGELLGGKGFAQVRLRTPAGPVVVVDTHLHAGTARSGSPAYRSHRVAQIVQLSHELREIRAPVLVAGDLNFQESEPEHAVLVGLAGVVDVAARLDRRQPTTLEANPFRRGSEKPDRRIDYVLARDGEHVGLRAVSIRRIYDAPLEIDGRELAYSNHAGVLAEVDVVAGAGRRVAPPDPAAVALAEELLGEGAAAARQERTRDRAWAGLGLAGAVVAATGRRAIRPTRRRFLGALLHLGAFAALAPGVNLSLSAEWLVSGELDAFRQARADLASLRRAAEAGTGVLASLDPGDSSA